MNPARSSPRWEPVRPGNRGSANGGPWDSWYRLLGVGDGGVSGGWDRPGHAMPNSLRTRGRRTQDGVVLAEDPIILLSVVLMALVPRGDRVLGHLRLERILVAEAEVGPVAGLVLEAL